MKILTQKTLMFLIVVRIAGNECACAGDKSNPCIASSSCKVNDNYMRTPKHSFSDTDNFVHDIASDSKPHGMLHNQNSFGSDKEQQNVQKFQQPCQTNCDVYKQEYDNDFEEQKYLPQDGSHQHDCSSDVQQF